LNININEKTKDILEWILCIIVAVILAIIVRYYVGTPTIVKQPSMYPTLKQDQRLLLNRWMRTTKKSPEREDIITFESPSETFVAKNDIDIENPVAKYSEKSGFGGFVHNVLEMGKISYIKRVIGLPGDHIKIEGGKVYLNDEKLGETYLQPGVVTDSLDGGYIDLIVPENHVFVMGDNRSQSVDSRRFGCIPFNKIESKVVLRFWPLNVFGKVK